MAATKDEKAPKNGLEVVCNLEKDGSYEFIYRLRSKLLDKDGKSLRSTIKTIPIPSGKQEMKISVFWEKDEVKGYDYEEKIEGKLVKLPRRVTVGRYSGLFKELYVLREGANV